MRQQRAFGHRPDARIDIVISSFYPVVKRAHGVCLHHGKNFGLALEPVGLETGNCGGGLGQYIPVRGQDEFNRVCFTGKAELVKRVEVVVHVPVRRVNHGGAAVQDVVATEQQAVFQQHQAQVVGRVTWRVQHSQGVAHLAFWRSIYKDQMLFIL